MHGNGERQGTPRHRGGAVLRQPVFPVRLQNLPRRASGGRSAVLDRQVRRRHRQLDVAAPYGRLLDIQGICRQGQRACRLFRGQRPVQAEAILQDLARRCQGGRLHLRLRLPRKHQGVCDVGGGQVCGRHLRPQEDRPPHQAPGHPAQVHECQPGGEDPVFIQERRHLQRLEEMAGRGQGPEETARCQREAGFRGTLQGVG